MMFLYSFPESLYKTLHPFSNQFTPFPINAVYKPSFTLKITSSSFKISKSIIIDTYGKKLNNSGETEFLDLA